MTILAIFPEDSAMWRHGERLFAAALGDRFRAVFDTRSALSSIGEAEIVLAFFLSPELAATATRARWIQALGSGLEGLLHARNETRMLSRMPGVHGPAVAEAAMAMMLALARDLPGLVTAQEARAWKPAPARLLSGGTLGILGTGAIARALAARAAAFDMRVVGFSASPRPVPGFDRVVDRASLRAEAETLDHLVLLAPLDDTTRHIVGTSVLAAMKPGALLVNVARGGLVDEEALVDALGSGRIGGAALDVFETEPLPPGSPLWTMSNVLVTPHVAGRHTGYVADVVNVFLANLALYDAGRPPMDLVTPG